MQPSVKTQKIIIQCSSSSKWEIFSFFLRKWLTVHVLLLQLLLLGCTTIFLCIQGATEEQWKARPLTGLGATRAEWCFYNHRGLACFYGLAGQREEQGIMVVVIFFLPQKVSPILRFFCKGNVGYCRGGLLLLANCSASPSSSAERGVSCIYIYIYIYLCIYAFPFPVSCE